MNIKWMMKQGVVILMAATVLLSTRTATAETATHDDTEEDERVFPVYPSYALFIGGGVFMLSGIITGSVALKLNSDLKDDCPGSACYEPHHDKVGRLESLSTATDVFIPLSIVAFGTGAFLYMLSKKTHESYDKKHAKRKDSPLKRLSLTGSGVSWRF